MPDLITIANILKGLPDEALKRELISPAGGIPPFLALSELKRRQDMRQAFRAKEATGKSLMEDLLSGQNQVPNPFTLPQPPQDPQMAQPQGQMPNAPQPQGMPQQPPIRMASGGRVRRVFQDPRFPIHGELGPEAGLQLAVPSLVNPGYDSGPESYYTFDPEAGGTPVPDSVDSIPVPENIFSTNVNATIAPPNQTKTILPNNDEEDQIRKYLEMFGKYRTAPVQVERVDRRKVLQDTRDIYKGEDYYAPIAARIAQIEAENEKAKKGAKGRALVQAGLAMAQSKNPTWGGAIAAGMSGGLGSYEKEKEEQRKRELQMLGANAELAKQRTSKQEGEFNRAAQWAHDESAANITQAQVTSARNQGSDHLMTGIMAKIMETNDPLKKAQLENERVRLQVLQAELNKVGRKEMWQEYADVYDKTDSASVAKKKAIERFAILQRAPHIPSAQEQVWNDYRTGNKKGIAAHQAMLRDAALAQARQKALAEAADDANKTFANKRTAQQIAPGMTKDQYMRKVYMEKLNLLRQADIWDSEGNPPPFRTPVVGVDEPPQEDDPFAEPVATYDYSRKGGFTKR